MSPRSCVQLRIGWCLYSRGNLQNAVESHHRPEPPVKSEHELANIRLQVLRTDAVVRSQQPRIKVAEDDVDHGKVLVNFDMVAVDRNDLVKVAKFL